MNIAYFHSFNNSFNCVVKNIHSKHSFIQQKLQIIHSKKLFIQSNPKLFIQKKYSFKWRIDYRPWLHRAHTKTYSNSQCCCISASHTSHLPNQGTHSTHSKLSGSLPHFQEQVVWGTWLCNASRGENFFGEFSESPSTL